MIDGTQTVVAANYALGMDGDKDVRAVFGHVVTFGDSAMRSAVRFWYFLLTGQARSTFTDVDLSDPRFTTLGWIGGKNLEGIQNCTSLKTMWDAENARTIVLLTNPLEFGATRMLGSWPDKGGASWRHCRIA